jgi:hypothetical protein
LISGFSIGYNVFLTCWPSFVDNESVGVEKDNPINKRTIPVMIIFLAALEIVLPPGDLLT